MSPIVSVCIPAFNHERFVAECVSSVLSQSFQDFEIVITDDASSDGTLDVLSGFRDPRISVHRHPFNLGPSAAINHCIGESKGKYVALLGSDDVFFPQKLAEQVAILDAAAHIGAVFSHARAVDEEGRILPDHNHPYPGIFRAQNQSRHGWLRRFFMQGNCLCAPSALIRRSVIDAVGNHDVRLYQLQDFDYWIRLCLLTDIHIVQHPLLAYRVHSNNSNLSAGRAEKAVRTLWEWQKVLLHYLAIEDRRSFLEVFPEASQITSAQDLSLRCLLARVAVAPDTPAAARLFGLDLLFDLLDSDHGRQALTASGFQILEFFELVGKSDDDRRRALWLLGVRLPTDSLRMRIRSNSIFRRLRGATYRWWPPH